MTLRELTLKIDGTRRGLTASDQMHHREALRYLRDERLGILCGCQEPTEEQVAIVHAQLFGEPEQKDLL